MEGAVVVYDMATLKQQVGTSEPEAILKDPDRGVRIPG